MDEEPSVRIKGKPIRIQHLTVAALVVVVSTTLSPLAHAETVEVFAAGSVRGVVTDLSKEASAFNIQVKTVFGGSGALRERIEKGEHPDILMSADLGSPRKLASEGRTVVPAIAFARNRMCIIARRSGNVTSRNLIDRMLDQDVRLKTSMPISDPGGDYAWAIFDRVETMRPGAGAILKRKAQALKNVSATPVTPTQSATAALFATHQIDMLITYCSGSAALLKETSDLTSLAVPAQLDPHPVYGLAVLSTKPEVMRLVLWLLSEQGQAIVGKAGLVPIAGSVP